LHNTKLPLASLIHACTPLTGEEAYTHIDWWWNDRPA